MDIVNNGWIDVSELAVNIPVLTVGKNSDGEWTTPIVATKFENGKIVAGYRFSGQRDIGFHFETMATHFQPLPNPPENK